MIPQNIIWVVFAVIGIMLDALVVSWMVEIRYGSVSVKDTIERMRRNLFFISVFTIALWTVLSITWLVLHVRNHILDAESLLVLIIFVLFGLFNVNLLLKVAEINIGPH